MIVCLGVAEISGEGHACKVSLDQTWKMTGSSSAWHGSRSIARSPLGPRVSCRLGLVNALVEVEGIGIAEIKGSKWKWTELSGVAWHGINKHRLNCVPISALSKLSN